MAPTDFSGSAIQAVTTAFELAQTFGAKLSLLHVIEVPAYAIEVALPLEALEQDARRELALLLPEAEAAHVDVTRLVDVGVPYQKIVETATAEQVDLIVMATHGRTGLSHLVLGSVAERMVRLAPCPVLTIRPPGERSVSLRTDRDLTGLPSPSPPVRWLMRYEDSIRGSALRMSTFYDSSSLLVRAT